jgi:hypothetical protein
MARQAQVGRRRGLRDGAWRREQRHHGENRERVLGAWEHDSVYSA